MKSSPEINAFKDRIRELEKEVGVLRETVVHYQAREARLMGMLQQIGAIVEEIE